MSALAWCPWCRDDASANGARVSAVAAPRGAGGCALTPWDGGGWECAECGARAPRQAWAQAQRWQEASDAQRTRAEAAEAELADVTRERDTARREAALSAAERDTLRGLTDALRAENARLRAIVEGRTTAPTDAEIDAHAATGGAWLVRFGARGLDVRNDPDFARITRDALNGAPTWWLPLDCEGRPTAWPVPA